MQLLLTASNGVKMQGRKQIDPSRAGEICRPFFSPGMKKTASAF
jgi:hypothetical protein